MARDPRRTAEMIGAIEWHQGGLDVPASIAIVKVAAQKILEAMELEYPWLEPLVEELRARATSYEAAGIARSDDGRVRIAERFDADFGPTSWMEFTAKYQSLRSWVAGKEPNSEYGEHGKTEVDAILDLYKRDSPDVTVGH